MFIDPINFLDAGLTVIDIEARAVAALTKTLDATFEEACRLLLNCQGRVVVTGMGKSGHIGRKIAATLASTGTPAFFMHPGEANHGDLGMIMPQDVILAISHSGTTGEITTLLPLIKRDNMALIAMTGHADSVIAKAATVHLNVKIEQEACPLGLAPTTSTTVALVMGDALAIALLKARDFKATDFARAHPGGALGRRLLLDVDTLAHCADDMPCVHEKTSVRNTLIEVTAKKLGMTCAVDNAGILTGIYTDGDIRRTLNQHIDIDNTCLDEIMTRRPKTVLSGTLASQALAIMEEFRITSLVIVDTAEKPIGVVHIHDLLRAGMV